jgi:hypothetical protein
VRSRVATLALALLSSGLAAVAAAEEKPADGWLTWDRGSGAEACPTVAEFTDKVAAHLGKPAAAVAELARIRILARIDSSSRGQGHAREWVALAKVIDATDGVLATRRISKTAETCGPISDALALVAAMVLSSSPIPDTGQADASKSDEAPSRDDQPVPAAPPEPAVVTSPPRSVSVPSPPRTWRAKVEAGPSLQVGRLPGVSFAGEMQAFLIPHKWPALFADLAYWPETRAQVQPDRGAAVGMWTAGLGLCPANLGASSSSFGLCVGFDVGRLHASGFGLDTPGNVDQWVLDLTVAARVEQRLGPHLYVDAGLLAAVPLVRTRVAYSTSTGETALVFQPWPTAAVCHMRIGYAFD